MSFKRVIAAAQKAARRAKGETIVYRRGALSATITATIGQTTVEQDDGMGQRIKAQVRDYLIAVADLELDDERIEPRDGDRIEEQTDSGTAIYEVMPIVGQKSWRYSDEHRQAYRIHTKQIN